MCRIQVEIHWLILCVIAGEVQGMQINHDTASQRVEVYSDDGDLWAQLHYSTPDGAARVMIKSGNCPLTHWEVFEAARPYAESAVKTAEARLRDS